jgi:hypothetical protein
VAEWRRRVMSGSSWMTVPLLLAACTQPRDFYERLETYQRQSSTAATQARRCSVELRSLAEHGPREASRALAASSSAQPEFVGLDRIRSEIDMSEKELEAACKTIARGTIDGPAALERMVSATARVRQIQARLCEARDVAFTLANVARPTSRSIVAQEAPRAP